MKHEQSLDEVIGPLIEAHFRRLRRTVRKNLARLTTAFLDLALSVRFGYGGLHLTSVARALPETCPFKSRYKWLARFLKCKYFDPSGLAECMLRLILGRQPSPGVIVLIDQTSVDGVEVVNAAIPLAGRAAPVTCVDFEYPWKTQPVRLFEQDSLAEKLRPYFEDSRRRPRHGTRKVLSALSMALYLLSDTRWAPQARQRFAHLLSTSPTAVGSPLLPPFHLETGGGQDGTLT